MNNIDNTINNNEYYNIEITEKLLKEIKMVWCETYNFLGSEDAIIPENLTHSELINNNKIEYSIIKYYYLPFVRFIDEDEFEEMKKHGFINQKETAFPPYSHVIFGAYHQRMALHNKLFHSKFGGYTINKKKIENINDLIPFFKIYSDGFKHGYYEFENECINPYLLMFSDKNDLVLKVFEFVTKNILFGISWINNHGTGMWINRLDFNEIILDSAYEDGKKNGYFYKAWTIIFTNNNLFAQLFNELDNNKGFLTAEIQPEPPHPFRKIEYYNKFVEYTEKHILDFHIDYSFLKKKMEKLNFIEKITDKDFFAILKKLNLVTPNNENDFLNKESKFYSLNKSQKGDRLNNFNNIFDL